MAGMQRPLDSLTHSHNADINNPDYRHCPQGPTFMAAPDIDAAGGPVGRFVPSTGHAEPWPSPPEGRWSARLPGRWPWGFLLPTTAGRLAPPPPPPPARRRS